jgi:hypothetical protein
MAKVRILEISTIKVCQEKSPGILSKILISRHPRMTNLVKREVYELERYRPGLFQF